MKEKDFKNWNDRKEQLHNGKIKENDFFKLQEKLLELIVTPLEKPKGAHDCDL